MADQPEDERLTSIRAQLSAIEFLLMDARRWMAQAQRLSLADVKQAHRQTIESLGRQRSAEVLAHIERLLTGIESLLALSGPGTNRDE
jgi:hypothetical protein